MTDTTTPTLDLAREAFLMDCSQGFDHGNYARAYETENYSDFVIALRSQPRSDAFCDAAVLGFCASVEYDELDELEREALEEALATPAGEQCLKAGYCDGWDE